MSKYHNKQTAASDGKVFASKRECKVYEDLRLLENIGVVKDLRTQVKYELIPKQEGERAVTWTADFVYEHDGVTVVCDAKGMRTQQYVIRRKLMKFIHSITITEV